MKERRYRVLNFNIFPINNAYTNARMWKKGDNLPLMLHFLVWHNQNPGDER